MLRAFSHVPDRDASTLQQYPTSLVLETKQRTAVLVFDSADKLAGNGNTGITGGLGQRHTGVRNQHVPISDGTASGCLNISHWGGLGF